MRSNAGEVAAKCRWPFGLPVIERTEGTQCGFVDNSRGTNHGRLLFFGRTPDSFFPCGGPPAQGGSEQVCLCLRACSGGIGEHQSRTETEGETGGFQRVPARRHVVHKVGLPER